MKTLLLSISILLSINTYANQVCTSSLDIDHYDIGYEKGIEMKIFDKSAISMINKLLPYGDCYQGVCSSYYSESSQAYVIKFNQKYTNGYAGRGKQASYLTIGTNGHFALSINNDNESLIFDFIDCYWNLFQKFIKEQIWSSLHY